MKHLPEETQDAVRQLAKGATVGMVSSALEKKGVGQEPSDEVLRIAKRVINRRARFKHLLIGVAGLAVLTCGGYLIYLCAADQDRRINFPVLVMAVGLLISLYGFYFSTQNEIQ